MQKTSQFKTQCKGDISHAFETAKITVFYTTVCKTPDVPLQNELLCWTLNLGYILGIAIPDCFSNPGISGLKNANPGIPGLNPGIESLILN